MTGRTGGSHAALLRPDLPSAICRTYDTIPPGATWGPTSTATLVLLVAGRLALHGASEASARFGPGSLLALTPDVPLTLHNDGGGPATIATFSRGAPARGR